jgi:hypothetical protein
MWLIMNIRISTFYLLQPIEYHFVQTNTKFVLALLYGVSFVAITKLALDT